MKTQAGSPCRARDARMTPLVDRVVRRLTDGESETEAPRLDHLDLAWDALRRRAQAVTTRRGRPVRLLLRVGTTLRHGDVLVDSADLLLVVDVTPCEVWVARPTSSAQSALVALEWGNLHVPVQVCADGTLLTPADGPALG